MEGEFVTGIGGGANGAKRSEINVESRQMHKGKLSFFCGNGNECHAFVKAAVLEPNEGVPPRGCK